MYNTILITSGVYHIFNKSIAGFRIFSHDSEFLRMQQIIRYYQLEKPKVRFSQYILNLKKENHINFDNGLKISPSGSGNLVEVIAYCIMPTHLHLILKQLKEKGISVFMNNILNSYTRYFNVKYKRKGPLWESRFKRVSVTTDEQLLHLTRYIHLNPVTAYLVSKPEQWTFSSYNEFLFEVIDKERICNYKQVLAINPRIYKRFVENNIEHQRELANIKELIFDHHCTA